jgi:hypothetical protein
MRQASAGSVITKRPPFGRLADFLNGSFNFDSEIKPQAHGFVFIIGYSF